MALLLAVAVLVAACGPSPASTVPAATAAAAAPTSIATPVPTATVAATPSPTARPVTYIPPACEGKPITTARPGATAVPTATPTSNKAIAKALQLRVFETLTQQVDATYLYPDFNGRDWPSIAARYRTEIEAGLETEPFYARMAALVHDLGDEHSRFESPAARAAFDLQLAGSPSYVGIGVRLQPLPAKGHVSVVSVRPGSPAARAGLQPHDAILTLDGIPLIENGVFQNRFLGPECSAIVIETRTPGGLVERKTIVRATVPGGSAIDARLVPTTDGSRVGYILVPTFAEGTIDEQVGSALADLSPLDGVIIDDRLNGGGARSVLEPMLGYFTSGTVGTFVSRAGVRTLTIRATPVNNSQTVPLVVLVSDKTVSYGEVFAGVLQDRGRAKLVGGTTRGNVETLRAVDLPDGSRAWIAQDRFEPSGSRANWERTGVTPDVEVKAEWDEFTFERDPAVAAALKVLGRR